jgi:hypothetical protein
MAAGCCGQVPAVSASLQDREPEGKGGDGRSENGEGGNEGRKTTAL